MSWILFIIAGFVIGLVARALVPGKQNLGIIWTTLLGIGGSLLGGFVANAVTNTPFDRLSIVGLIGGVIGAVVLLLIYGAVMKRRGGGDHHPGHTFGNRRARI